MTDLTAINDAIETAYQTALANPRKQPATPVNGNPDQTVSVILYETPQGSGFRVAGRITVAGHCFVRILNHGPDEASARDWPDIDHEVARRSLVKAEQLGITLPFGGGTITLAAKEKDRSLFAQALILFREAEDLQPDAAAKEAFRNSTVTIADHSGIPHALTVSQARQLLVAFGSAYQTLWNTARII
jgi:hypothetical protein